MIAVGSSTGTASQPKDISCVRSLAHIATFRTLWRRLAAHSLPDLLHPILSPDLYLHQLGRSGYLSLCRTTWISVLLDGLEPAMAPLCPVASQLSRSLWLKFTLLLFLTFPTLFRNRQARSLSVVPWHVPIGPWMTYSLHGRVDLARPLPVTKTYLLVSEPSCNVPICFWKMLKPLRFIRMALTAISLIQMVGILHGPLLFWGPSERNGASLTGMVTLSTSTHCPHNGGVPNMTPSRKVRRVRYLEPPFGFYRWRGKLMLPFSRTPRLHWTWPLDTIPDVWKMTLHYVPAPLTSSSRRWHIGLPGTGLPMYELIEVTLVMSWQTMWRDPFVKAISPQDLCLGIMHNGSTVIRLWFCRLVLSWTLQFARSRFPALMAATWPLLQVSGLSSHLTGYRSYPHRMHRQHFQLPIWFSPPTTCTPCDGKEEWPFSGSSSPKSVSS